VDSLSPLIAWLLVLVTLGVAGYFAWQQVRMLRALPSRKDLAPVDRTYFHRQGWRRLVGCVLLLVVAIMLSSWYLFGIDAKFDELRDVLQAQRAAGEVGLHPEQEQAKRFFAYYWIAVLLLLLTIVSLAGIDLNAIRRYAARHSRQIREDRRAMLERELANFRRDRRAERGDPSVN
jgi:hypothetical protein